MKTHQITMVSLEDLVKADHQYRKFKEIFDFGLVRETLKSVENRANYKGYGVERLFKCLLLQFMENLSDRELEKYLSDSNAAKWFFYFDLTESKTDYRVFSKLRAKISTNLLSKIFSSFAKLTALTRLYERCLLLLLYHSSDKNFFICQMWP
jgi:transposase